MRPIAIALNGFEPRVFLESKLASYPCTSVVARAASPAIRDRNTAGHSPRCVRGTVHILAWVFRHLWVVAYSYTAAYLLTCSITGIVALSLELLFSQARDTCARVDVYRVRSTKTYTNDFRKYGPSKIRNCSTLIFSVTSCAKSNKIIFRLEYESNYYFANFFEIFAIEIKLNASSSQTQISEPVV